MVGADVGHIVFGNPLFAKMVASDGAGTLRACVAMAADQTEITASREIVHDDRRTLTIETKRLPQGQLLVTAEDISARLAERVLSAERARTDQLTRLGNRLMFSERLQSDCGTVPSRDRPCGRAVARPRSLQGRQRCHGPCLGDAL